MKYITETVQKKRSNIKALFHKENEERKNLKHHPISYNLDLQAWKELKDVMDYLKEIKGEISREDLTGQKILK